MLNIFAKRTEREKSSDRRNQAVLAAALPRTYFQGIEGEHAEKVLARRRAKNKVARKSRRVNRR